MGHEAFLSNVDLYSGLLALSIPGAAGQEMANNKLIQSLFISLWRKEESLNTLQNITSQDLSITGSLAWFRHRAGHTNLAVHCAGKSSPGCGV